MFPPQLLCVGIVCTFHNMVSAWFRNFLLAGMTARTSIFHTSSWCKVLYWLSCTQFPAQLRGYFRWMIEKRGERNSCCKMFPPQFLCVDFAHVSQDTSYLHFSGTCFLLQVGAAMYFETIIFIELLVQSSLSAVPCTQFSVQLHGCCCMIWASHDSTQGGTSNSS
jgi:hypothetical protein